MKPQMLLALIACLTGCAQNAVSECAWVRPIVASVRYQAWLEGVLSQAADADLDAAEDFHRQVDRHNDAIVKRCGRRG